MTSTLRLSTIMALLLLSSRVGIASDSAITRHHHSDVDSALAAMTSPDEALVLSFIPLYGPIRQQFDRALTDITLGDDQRRIVHLVMIDPQYDDQTLTAYGISRLPTTILLNRDRVIIDVYVGMPSARSLGAWLRDGLQSMASGAWAGLGQAAPAGGPIAIELGAQDPQLRLTALQRLAVNPHDHIPALITGLDHDHLAVRVACARQLRRLLPGLPAYDAWHDRQQRHAAAALISQWWQELDHSQLPPPPEGLDGEVLHAALQAIAALEAPEPPLRTAAMTRLVQFGDEVLPLLRSEEASPASARTRAMVRWMVLVPDTIESRRALRTVLTNGSSVERQEAVESLAQLGAEALPILTEILHDEDVLVRESALSSLGTIGGAEAMQAVASALTSDDSNLRMVAARQLGQTRDANAAALVAEAGLINDDDEMVAVAAITAIADARGERQEAVLIQALEDPRWRVRAAAATAIASLRISTPTAAKALADRLEDTDPFVIAEVIKALTQARRPPSDERLFSVIERLPDLAQDIARMLGRSETDRLPSVTALLQRSPPQARAGIFNAAAAAHSRHNRNRDQAWLRLATTALEDDPDPALREAALRLLSGLSPTLTIPLLDQFIKDPIAEVRHVALEAMVAAAAYDWGFSTVRDDHNSSGFGVISGQAPVTKTPQPTPSRSTLGRLASLLTRGRQDQEPASDQPPEEPDSTDNPQQLAQARHQVWLEDIQDLDDDTPFLILARLLCSPEAQFTEQALTLLPQVSWPQDGVGHRDHAWRQAIGALMLRSAHDPVIMGLLRADPVTCLIIINNLQLLSSSATPNPRWTQAQQAIRDIIAEDDYLLAAAAHNPGVFAGIVLNSSSHPLFAINDSQTATRLQEQLIAAEDPWLRVIGYSAAIRARATPELITTGLADPDPRIHLAVLQAMTRSDIAEVVREELAAPLVAADDLEMSLAALRVLVHPGFHDTLDLRSALRRIEVADRRIWIGHQGSRASTPSIIQEPLDRQPAFLNVIAERQVPMDSDRERQWNLTAMLVLAQYGDNRLIDRFYGLREQDATSTQALFQALSLTSDERLLPLLRDQFENASDRNELVTILNTLSGLRSREARILRRDINRRLQTMPQ